MRCACIESGSRIGATCSKNAKKPKTRGTKAPILPMDAIHALRRRLAGEETELLTPEETAPAVILVVIIILVIYALWKFVYASVYIVRHAEVMIVERWGKYYTTLKPGLHFLVPFMDTPRKVKWRYVSRLPRTAPGPRGFPPSPPLPIRRCGGGGGGC